MKSGILCPTALLLVASLTACHRSERVRVADEFKETARQYCSADVTVARNSLLRHCETLRQWRRTGMELDYDQAFAVAEARLFALERRLHKEQQAEQFFRSCTNHLVQGRLKRGQPAKVYSIAEVLAIVDQADKDLTVQWKGNGMDH